MIKLNVFGRIVQVERDKGRWSAYYPGNEGKRRPAHDIVIPGEIKMEELVEYIADLCHEWASAKHNDVLILEWD